MFLSRGRTIAIHDPWRNSLREVLREHMLSRFTGRIISYARKYDAYIEILRGEAIGLIVVEKERGNIYYGDKAVDYINRLLDVREGMIEVIELDENKVNIDLNAEPSARVKQETASELNTILGLAEYREQEVRYEAKPEVKTSVNQPRSRIAEVIEAFVSHAANHADPYVILSDVVALSMVVLRSRFIGRRVFRNLYELEYCIKNELIKDAPLYITCKARDKEIRLLIQLNKYGIVITNSSGTRRVHESDYRECVNIVCKIFKI